MKLILLIHTFTQSFRHLFVLSGLGTVSYCKHSPTCSEYAIAAIEQHGILIGVLKGTWRVLRCW